MFFLKKYIFLEHWILIPIYRQFQFENNFKRMMNRPVTRDDMNEVPNMVG